MFNRERLVFARVALALAVLWAVVGAHLSHTRTLKDEATGERLRTTTEIAMAQLDAAIRHTDDVLLHTKGAVERFGPGLLIDDILPARAWSPAVPYDGITVLDPAGVAVVATGARLTAALATALVTRPIDDVRGLVVSAAPPEAADARDRIWLSRHVQSPDGTFASTVAARVSAERIDALLAAAGVDTDAVRLRLVDDAGRLFAGHPPGVEDRTVAIPIERLGLVLRGSLDAAHWRSAWRTEATPILVLTALVTLLLLLVARMRTGRATAVDRAFGPAFDRAFDRGMAEAATAAEPVSRDLGALAGAFAGRRVLIALDDPATRAIVATQLAAFGCIVDAVEDGHEAVTQARNGTFDLILLDGQMPGMDGPEAARQIRQAEAAAGGGARTPIIALTAESPAEERARARAAG
ncbi:MAG: response regulator, partial [Alphaproteobacteria bacterium]|nr:response regulator [Alphaproteobacteria bacterium]